MITIFHKVDDEPYQPNSMNIEFNEKTQVLQISLACNRSVGSDNIVNYID
jgi:hypothetical protein